MDNVTYTPNVKDWTIKVQERSRGRMKVQVKLSAEEAEALRSFLTAVKPEDVSTDTFFKGIFMKGWEAYHTDIEAQYMKHIEENREQYEVSGFTFDEAGKVTGFNDGEEVEGDSVVEVE